MSHACHRFWTCYKTLTFCSLLVEWRIPCACHTKTTLQRPKAAQTCGALYILTSKCASRHNGVHFFDVSTSKSAPRLKCFVHFDFDMYFAPQRRALFRHLNFQKWSDVGCALYVLTSKCASRRNGVHFFISHLTTWLRTRPPEPQIIGKTRSFATFLPFRAPASSFFSLFLLSDLLSSALLLSDSSHLCCSICPILSEV